ncbi:transcriptional regulator [Bacteroides xylanisolvens]|nr:transcriptional regulator [Bacteroides xylanisolvens]
MSGSESGVLRIGVAPARGEVLLPPLLEVFHRRYPRVRIVLCEMANAMIWKALEREEIDLALARWEEELPGVSLYPYQEEEIVLLLSADLYQRLPGTEEERARVLSAPQKELPVFLEPCDFLLNSEGDIAGRLARKLFREASFAPRVAAESEHMATFCPKNLAEAMLAPSDMQKLHQIAFTEGKYMISFACHESSHRWSMIENFLKIAGK